MSFAIRKGILAFGLAMGAAILACQIWALFASWRLPLWWTVGPIPAVLFAYTLMHTERWRTQQLYSYKWWRIALWMVLPFLGIALGVNPLAPLAPELAIRRTGDRFHEYANTTGGNQGIRFRRLDHARF